ncbi:uncharacterized protein CBL_14575 [Carabus blaptoides fortunei]
MAASQDDDESAIVDEAIRLCVVTDDLLRIVKERAVGLLHPWDDSLGADAPEKVMEDIIETNNFISLMRDFAENHTVPFSEAPWLQEKVSYGHYSWVQTVSKFDVEIQNDENLTSSQLFVKVAPRNILVQSRVTQKIYLEGSLFQKCEAAETTCVIDGSKIKLCIKKAIISWWDRLIVSEPKLKANN